MDEPWKYYVKWKISVTKNHVLYIHEMIRMGKPTETENRQMLSPLGLGAGGGVTENERNRANSSFLD